ncbi:MAG: CotH kinase family protein [Pseudomonadota bacterium]
MKKPIIQFSRLLAFALFALTTAPASAYEWPGVYDPLQLLTLNLNMAPGDWSTVKSDTSLGIEVPATFWADGEAPILVSVRRKSGDALGDKVSLKIDINDFVSGQKWSGLKKLSLENGDDVDVVAEGFAWYLNRVAAAASNSGYNPGLAAWVKLFVNGEYLGVYLNVEQPDKTFLKHRGLYTKNETWLYKSGDAGESGALKVGDPDSPTTTALCYAPFGATGSDGGGKGGGKKGGGGGGSTGCTVPDSDSALATELNKLIDMEALLTLAAVSAFHMGPDDLFSKGKNFYYIDYLGGDKRLYTQWDLDTVFASKSPDGSIYGSAKKGKRGSTELSQTAYQAVILNNSVFRAQYDRIMAGLLNGPLQIDAQIAFLNKLEGVLTSALEADPNNNIDVGGVPERFDALRKWMRGRVSNINDQLGN